MRSLRTRIDETAAIDSKGIFWMEFLGSIVEDVGSIRDKEECSCTRIQLSSGRTGRLGELAHRSAPTAG
jgi:hypothetical protein